MALLDCGQAAEPAPSSAVILQRLREFRECGSVLYIAAHPDDENTQFIAYLAKERAMRVGYLSLTRGEGGQDLIGPEIGDPLGVIRTQELLAARRIDGGQQFFTRAKDFGFSKDYEQTLAKWDRREVLSDVVRVIRKFQPDVVVTRFPPEPGGTHGHHTASTVLALEAFKLAGDAQAFPEQLDQPGGCTVWQPERIFWNAFRSSNRERATLRLDIGGFIPLLGLSVGEIAALSRSSHRSQGYGTVAVRGSRLDEFQALDGKPVGRDLFDGIDTTWHRFPDGDRIDQLASGIIARFDPANPAASVPALLALRTHVVDMAADDGFHRRKIELLDRILQDCLGLYIETTVPQSEVVPGEPIKYSDLAILRSNSPVPVVWLGTSVSEADAKPIEMRPNQPVVRETTDTRTAGLVPSQPYWLREESTPGMYRLEVDRSDSRMGTPEAAPERQIEHSFRIGDQTVRLPVEPVQVTADPAKGEIRRRMEIIPPVSLALGRGVQLFVPNSKHQVEVEIKAYRGNQSGTLTLGIPAGWQVTPAAQPFKLADVGDHTRFTFIVTAPLTPQTANLVAHATIDGKTYSTSRQEIRYEHIPPQLLQSPARIRGVCLDLAVRGQEVGYLPGAGDNTASAIEAMGYNVTQLTGSDLNADRLKSFDAIVIGVRAFNVRADLVSGLNPLFAYAENGGNLVIQYNTPNDLKTTRLTPYNLELSRDLPHNRVTNENAPVTLLVPEHPVFTTPNRITSADFDGWVQERGLNFPNVWDTEHFTALLACSDPGEAPLKSGLLVANYGKGHVVYTGLSFFRQLPAGVPGAYRLFANLISLGK